MTRKFGCLATHDGSTIDHRPSFLTTVTVTYSAVLCRHGEQRSEKENKCFLMCVLVTVDGDGGCDCDLRLRRESIISLVIRRTQNIRGAQQPARWLFQVTRRFITTTTAISLSSLSRECVDQRQASRIYEIKQES